MQIIWITFEPTRDSSIFRGKAAFFPICPSRSNLCLPPRAMQTTLGKGDDPASSSFSRQLGVLAPISNATGTRTRFHPYSWVLLARSLAHSTQFSPAPRDYSRQLLNHNGASSCSCSGPFEFSGLGNIEEMRPAYVIKIKLIWNIVVMQSQCAQCAPCAPCAMCNMGHATSSWRAAWKLATCAKQIAVKFSPQVFYHFVEIFILPCTNGKASKKGGLNFIFLFKAKL